MNRPNWLLKPIEEYDELPLEQIAYNLSGINRFAGALRWSVLQHSLLVADLCVVKPSAWALLHDAHEAWDGDCTKLAKDALGIAWENFEAKRREQICHVAGMTVCKDELEWVHAADKLAADIEMTMSRYGLITQSWQRDKAAECVSAIRRLQTDELIDVWCSEVLSALHVCGFRKSVSEANTRHEVQQ